MTWEGLISIILGSNALFGLIQFLITRHLEQRDTMRKTMAAISYWALSDRIERCLNQNFATPGERRELEVLFEAYKENGWNGDMDARIKKVYALPTKELNV